MQIVYERNLRPEEKRHEPWLARVRGQLEQAYRLLEAECAALRSWFFGSRPLQADITSAVVWRFTQHAIADVVGAASCPALAALSARAEALPEWRAVPVS